MSLYRKWRPLGFADLVGQESVVRTLSHALNTGKLVHAYLFSGPRGSGKTSAAKIMARAITCEHGPNAVPDNTCENCKAILAGTALDVVEIDAASNRGIDEIRALRDAVKFAPATMRKKVYIVDEVHMLTKEGANAFLKTLEEPPPHVVFILATTAPEALPVTILSRCQRYAFRRIPTGIMVERMRMIAEAEGIAIDTDALRTIAQRADGGLRDALTMLEQAAAFADGAVDTAVLDAAYGASGREYATALLDGFVANDAAVVLRAIDAASAAGVDMANFIRHVIAELRCVLLVRVDADLLTGELLEDELALANERAARLPQVRLLRALRLLADALSQSRQSGNPRLELESAMLRLTLQGEDPSLEALATRVKMLEDRLAAGGSLSSAAPAAAHSLPSGSGSPVVAPVGTERAAKPVAKAAAKAQAAETMPPSALPTGGEAIPEALASEPIAAPAKKKAAAATPKSEGRSGSAKAANSAAPVQAEVSAAPVRTGESAEPNLPEASSARGGSEADAGLSAPKPRTASSGPEAGAASSGSAGDDTWATAQFAPQVHAGVPSSATSLQASSAANPAAVVLEVAEPVADAAATPSVPDEAAVPGAKSSGAKGQSAKPDFADAVFADEPRAATAPAAYATPISPLAADAGREFDRTPSEAARLAQVQAEATAAASAGEEPTLARLRSLWPNVRARAESKIPSLRGPLSRTSPGIVTGWNITLNVADTQNAELLRNRLTTIEGALSDVLGGTCRVAVTVASGTPLREAKKNDITTADAALGLLDYAEKRLGVAGDEPTW